jgi:SAM-dependent methyltransferase
VTEYDPHDETLTTTDAASETRDGMVHAIPSDTDLAALRAEQERLGLEVAHWRGLYEQLVDDARANITDAEGQIEMARNHIEELVGFVDGARELEGRLTQEVAHWRGLFEGLEADARGNAEQAEKEIADARDNIRNLVSEIGDFGRERARLVAEIDYWSTRADNRNPAPGLLASLVNRVRNRLRPETPKSPVPPYMLRARGDVSKRYLRGTGLEIGALHSPVPVSGGVEVQYVDQMTRPEQRVAFTDLREYAFVEVEIIDDGERLESIGNDSVDFVIASHVLEHCENPLGTLRNHLRKVRPGGHLFYIVPDNRFSFDSNRPTTPFPHLVRDDTEGPETSRREHYLEYARLVDETPSDEVERAADRMEATHADIHFHVWDQSTTEELWRQAQGYLENSFSIEYTAFSFVENIAVLRRRA